MALSQKRQQQKKAKKQKQRQQKVKQIKAQSNLPAYLSPIEGAYESPSLWEQGIGSVLITRRKPNGELYMANYLLDVWCLGVKDAFVKKIEPEMLGRMLEHNNMQAKDPSYCKALIMASAEYGKTNGLRANIDEKSERFIRAIQYKPEDYNFEFGKDGKPFYMNGPHDAELLPKMGVDGDHFGIVQKIVDEDEALPA